MTTKHEITESDYSVTSDHLRAFQAALELVSGDAIPLAGEILSRGSAYVVLKDWGANTTFRQTLDLAICKIEHLRTCCDQAYFGRV